MEMDDYEMNIMNYLNQVTFENYIQNHRLLEMLNLIGNEKRKYKVQTRIYPFEIYDDNKFGERYRMSKNQVMELFHLIDGVNTLEPMVIIIKEEYILSLSKNVFLRLKVTRDGFTIPGINKLLIALRFYAVGSFLSSVGDMFGVSKSSVCDVVAEVSFLIAMKLKDRFIRMPINEQEILNTKAMF